MSAPLNPLNIELMAGGPPVNVQAYLGTAFQNPSNVGWTWDRVLQPISILPSSSGFNFQAPVGMPATLAPAAALATDNVSGAQGTVLVTVVVPALAFLPGPVDLWDDGGVLAAFASANFPSSAIGLVAGAIWSNAGVVSVVPGITPIPGQPPVFFSLITAPALLALGGGILPATNPGAGTGQLWNNGGVVSIA